MRSKKVAGPEADREYGEGSNFSSLLDGMKFGWEGRSISML